MSNSDPIGGYHFSLKLSGVEVATFTDATIGDHETQVIEYREVDKDGKLFLRKTIGNTKYGDIVLKRGMTSDNALFNNWRQAVIDGDYQKARVNGSIVGRNPKGEPVVQYDFVNGWISKYKVSPFSAKGNDAATEEITITHEGVKRST